MNKAKIVTNFIWRFSERVGAQVVGLLVSFILARLLEPTVYGTIALVNVFLTILQVFVDSGLGTALIQKKEADQVDFSSVFYFNILMSIVIYIALFFAAPLIADFYDNQEMIAIIRVVSVIVLISGVRGIQQAYVSRTGEFKKFFVSTLIATLLSAVIGIYMAYNGFGVWALVAQSISSAAIGTVILWVTVKWRPTLQFSFERLKGLLGYGWKILGSSLIISIYANLRQLLIGKIYTTEDLAYYNKGNEIPNKIVPNIEASVTSVLLPAVSQQQDDLNSVKETTRKTVKTMSFAMWPMMLGMAACAENLIELLLTEKWLPSVSYLQVFCVEAVIWPISSVYYNSINAIGRSDINLKIQLVVRSVGIVILFLAIKQGVFFIALTSLIVSLLEFSIVSMINRKLISYKLKEQVRDIVPSMLLALAMGAVVLGVGYFNFSNLVSLVLQVAVGVAVYCLGAYILKFEAFRFILKLLSGITRKFKRG